MHGLRYIILLFSLLVLPQVTCSTDAYAQKRTTTKTTSRKKASAKTTKTAAKKIDKKTQLRNEKAATVKARQASQKQAAQLGKNIKANLDSVLILDHQIGRQRASIDSLGREIKTLGSDIELLTLELNTLQSNLEMRKQHYAKALVYMRRNRTLQSKLMFIFSAKNFSQLTRRFRYMREYSTFQKAQAKIIHEQQIVIRAKQNELLSAKSRLESSRATMQTKQISMEKMKSACQIKVNFLNKNLATVQQQIKIYQQKEASLDAEIERVIQAEIEAARRAEAERQRKLAEAKAKAEAARRKAAEERARKLAEAKAAQERARKAAAEAEAKRKAAEEARRAAKSAEEKAAAKAAEESAKAEAAKAKADIKTAEADLKVVEKEEKAAEKAEKKAANSTIWSTNESDVRLSKSFTSNKGRLPMPITGDYQIVGRYGRYTPPGLSGVVLDNKGIDIRGQQGAQARAVFDGEVSRVFQYAGRFIVMLRHGSYISVYSGLSSVSVSQGQKVSTRTPLGAVGVNSDGNYVLQFQLRNESSRLNPQSWVR